MDILLRIIKLSVVLVRVEREENAGSLLPAAFISGFT